MRINPGSMEPVRPERPVAANADQQKSYNPNGVASAETTGTRADSVQISAAGQSLSGRVERLAGDMDADRMSALRARVLGGAYDALDVVDEVARRILARGDL
jgi:hypothetical protein